MRSVGNLDFVVMTWFDDLTGNESGGFKILRPMVQRGMTVPARLQLSIMMLRYRIITRRRDSMDLLLSNYPLIIFMGEFGHCFPGGLRLD
jgi:hypothetical protein